MEFIDTHAHVFAEEFDTDQKAVIQRALEARVKHILLPNIDLGSVSALKRLCQEFPHQAHPMMGLHPCSVQADYQLVLSQLKTELFASPETYCGVGEIGIDLYWDKTFEQEQVDAFVTQCQWAVDLQKGVSIHTRSATYLAIAALKGMPLVPRGVFHCFSGSLEEANEIIKLGFKLGIGGVVTFKNTHLVETLKQISLNHIVIETDSPYLAPVPYRGKRNEPSYIPFIAEKLSDIYECSVETIAQATTESARSVFNF
jgi:TatD DNase family protein